MLFIGMAFLDGRWVSLASYIAMSLYGNLFAGLLSAKSETKSEGPESMILQGVLAGKHCLNDHDGNGLAVALLTAPRICCRKRPCLGAGTMGLRAKFVFGGLFFAGKMRSLNYTTMLDPIEDRFGQPMAAILYLPALMGEMFWTAAVLTALGTTFGALLGIDSVTAILLSSFITILYTSLGGLKAVALTDVLQLVILIIGLCLRFLFYYPKVQP